MLADIASRWLTGVGAETWTERIITAPASRIKVSRSSFNFCQLLVLRPQLSFLCVTRLPHFLLLHLKSSGDQRCSSIHLKGGFWLELIQGQRSCMWSQRQKGGGGEVGGSTASSLHMFSALKQQWLVLHHSARLHTALYFSVPLWLCTAGAFHTDKEQKKKLSVT